MIDKYIYLHIVNNDNFDLYIVNNVNKYHNFLFESWKIKLTNNYVANIHPHTYRRVLYLCGTFQSSLYQVISGIFFKKLTIISF